LINVSPDPAGLVMSTLFPGSATTTLSGISQNMGCVVKSLTGNPLLTTTTSTTALGYCYTVEFIGEGNFYWVDVFGQTQSVFIDNTTTSTTVCAQYNSFSSDGGLIFTLCSDYLPCTTEGDCPTTTTTSSTSSTTTSTTTTP